MGMSPVVLFLAFAVAPADRSQAERPYDFRETVLSNGLRVISLEDASCPIVAVQVWYHVGSKDESADRNGFAHMFEHMMFRGTDRLGPTDHFDRIRRTGGSSNGFTSFDNTTYIDVAPANQLPLLLWLEAERMAALRIDEAGFETERRVVEEERRLGLEQPYGTIPEQVLPVLFPGHPYRWTPIGTIPHLRAATIDELQAFWDRYYVPNNATLVIAGAVRHAAAQEAAQRFLGWIPRCPDPPRVATPAPASGGPRTLTLQEKTGPVPLVAIAYRGASLSHPDGPALEILAAILGRGDSSRLHRALVKKTHVATVAMAMAYSLEQAGLVGAGAALLPFGETERAMAALEAEIDRLRDEGVTEAELTKAKNVLIRDLVTARLAVESKATLLGRAATLLGDPEEANRDLARYRQVSAQDVRRVAKTYLVAEGKTAVIVKPSILGAIAGLLRGAMKGLAEDEGAEAPPAPAAGRRATPTGPKASAVRPASMPDSPPDAPLLDDLPSFPKQEKRLENGLRVVVVSNGEVPFVTIGLTLRSGASSEDPGKPGTAALACAMLAKGTAHRTADEIAEELESHAIEIDGSAGHDDAGIWASAVSDQFALAMANLAEVVREPTFPAGELETLRRSMLTGKAVDEREPSQIARTRWMRAVFGGHPYAREAGGTSEDLRRITADDLEGWWSAFARPDAAILYVAGDVAVEEAFALAEKSFGSWKPATAAGAPPPAPDAARIPEPGRMRIVLVDRPDAVQSQIRIGHASPLTRGAPDWPAAGVLNQVFGGAFSSRLNAKVRVEKGLTYGIRGGFQVLSQSGYFLISTFTKTPKTAEAIRVILEEVERLRAEPPSDDELARAKSYLGGSFARGRETPQAVVRDLWTIASQALPADHFRRYLKGVAATRPDDVLRVAREAVHPEALVIAVVGDARRIRADLEAIAPVEVVE
ncbi:MAG: insulinase family protein [Planctomycetes bacterium]|nr:insulinase family protein [Planctomycetota bacterium]